MGIPDERNPLDEKLSSLWVDRNIVYKTEALIPLHKC